MNSPGLDASIADLGSALRRRTLTSQDLTAHCLERIAAGRRYNAFITVLADSALESAKAADLELERGADRGPLHGIPISIKDLIDMQGVPTTAASRVREGHVATADAPIVRRLRASGAVIVGKCNLHEFAYGTTSEETAFGTILNPTDPSRSAGGSSGGSAVAVATGMSVASIGTDTGGSIRIPAAACGVVGLKAGYGEVSCDGVVALARSLDHVGPLARSVADAVILHGILTDQATGDLTPRSPRGLRLGVPRAYFLDLLDDDVRQRFEEALERLRAEGVSIANVDVPNARDVAAIYLHIALPEASAYHATAVERTPEAYSPGVRLRIEMGRYVLAEDYVRAMEGRECLRRDVDAALDSIDALILPTLPIPAPPIGTGTITVNGKAEPVRSLMLRLTQPFNLTGHPAISIPAGVTKAGLPCAVQLVGQRHDTIGLLATALACETTIRQGPRAHGAA